MLTHDDSDSLPACQWSMAVALDPKHRPQEPSLPSTTVRMEWRRFPQEAHLLDVKAWRYRRLLPDEIATLQGFPSSWAADCGLTTRERIAGLGNAVPPPLARVLAEELDALLPGTIDRYVEICAGFGGLALGVHQALGVVPLALIDAWAVAGKVLRNTGLWPSGRVHETDIRSFDWSSIGSLDLLCGGPPCQPWSQAGHSLGSADERDLLGETPELVSQLKPRAFLFENVPGLIGARNRPYCEWLVSKLRNAAGSGSYAVAVARFQAADYGVPQRRSRVIIAGIRGGSPRDVHELFDRVYQRRTHTAPAQALHNGLRPWVTIAEALPDWGDKALPWRRWIDRTTDEGTTIMRAAE